MRRRESWRVRGAQPGVSAGLLAVAWVCLVCALAACRTAGSSADVRDPGGACVDATPPSATALNVGIGRAVDPSHAPVAHHVGERLVFRQLYDTLVRVDCGGELVSGLAESWRSDDGGRTWTFRLHPDARFWDGAPVTARAVIDGWAAVTDAPALAWVTAVGERELRVALPAPVDDARVFSHPALAVVRGEEADGWPVGTGPYRPAESAVGTTSGARAPEQLRIVSVVRGTAAPPAIVFHVFDGRDARSALDAGMDVVVSGDAAVVEYARVLADYTIVPLPWTRTYVLATHAAPADPPEVVLPPDDVRAMLARDAAPVGTRAASLPFDWAAGVCERAASAPLSGASSARGTRDSARRALVHLSGDPVARGLAERIVALAWPFEQAPAWLHDALPSGAVQAGAPMTLALDEGALTRSLLTRQDIGYVVALPRGARACNGGGAVDDIERAVLARAAGGTLRITPLVDGRDHLIRQDSVGALTIDSDGTIRFGGVIP